MKNATQVEYDGQNWFGLDGFLSDADKADLQRLHDAKEAHADSFADLARTPLPKIRTYADFLLVKDHLRALREAREVDSDG